MALAGGAEKVLAQHKAAMAEDDLVWASRLAGWLLTTDPDNEAFRQAQADALCQIAQRAPGTIARHVCLTRALVLEGKVKVPAAVLPEPAAMQAMEPVRTTDFQRIRLAPGRGGTAVLPVGRYAARGLRGGGERLPPAWREARALRYTLPARHQERSG